MKTHYNAHVNLRKHVRIFDSGCGSQRGVERRGSRVFFVSAFLREMDNGYGSWEGVERRGTSGRGPFLRFTSAIRSHPSVLGGRAAQAGPLAERESDVFSESRAGSLVKGFENSAPVWLSQAPPCASPTFVWCMLTRSFPLVSPSGLPSGSLPSGRPAAWLWLSPLAAFPRESRTFCHS
jgi:hypothetical protein